MREVAVVGIGSTKFGEHWEKSLEDLAIEVGIKALEDANMEGKEIEAIFGGNMAAGQFTKQEHLGALIVDRVGLAGFGIPSTRVEAACASGGVAAHVGILAVASGYYDVVMAAGVEKMTEVGGGEATDILMSAADREWEGFVGLTFVGLYALIKRLHMQEFGTTDEQCALVSVKNHKNAVHNPLAHFRKEITIKDVLNSRYVAEPIHFLECSPISDGAAAIILVPAEKAKNFTDTPIYVKASAQAGDTLALQNRENLTAFKATKIAAKRAYRQARLTPKDIDFCEVHDAFSICEIIAIEDLGFCKKGEGGKAVEEGLTALDGKIPINTSGGLKAKGHAVGATGIAQIYEAVVQLRGEAGKRQVDGAETGMIHNAGGTGATAVVTILSR
jgi:acetyl-CoA C-acetyltransferase